MQNDISTVCQRCGKAKHLVFAHYNKNIGMGFSRRETDTKGYFCGKCIRILFWDNFLTCLFLGWGGIISAVTNPFRILFDIAQYISAEVKLGGILRKSFYVFTIAFLIFGTVMIYRYFNNPSIESTGSPISYETIPSNTEGVPTPTTTTTNPIPSPTATPRLKPNIVLPAGKSAFYGIVMWGDMPVNNGTVIGETQNPAIIQVPGTEWEAKRFTANTDNNGDYVLIVEPDEYYLGCSLPGSDYISYTSFGYGLIGVLGREISIGEFLFADFEATDWSIELISPGSTEPIYHPPLASENAITVNSTPTLSWREYNWQKYSTEQNYHGYYMINIELYNNDRGFYSVEKGESNVTSYSVVNPLQKGDYLWEVRAYTKSGKEIAGTEKEFYFVVP